MKKLLSLVLLICIMCGCASAESGSDVSTSLDDPATRSIHNKILDGIAIASSFVAPSTTEPPVEPPVESLYEHLFRKARWKLELADLSLDQLVDMQQLLTAAMWATEEWQSVEVPAGVYEIGKDIPAGYWTISPNSRCVKLEWGTKLNANKAEIDGYQDMISYRTLDSEDVTAVSWDLAEGTYLIIDYGSVIFTPFAGITLGFK